LQKGRPMDRLICGDVGFGKTEVALRAAFVAAYAGKQVAVVVPTTLLARQHFKTFTERFKGLPLRIAQASRLVPRKELLESKKQLAEGQIDIIIGTHALLADSIKFRDLGLMIVDEEQHFGVKHKERLKQMRANVHVLTLSATPIPRTLQLALSGIREMSLITTPPLDRLAVRTYIAPFDPVVIREHLLREHFRGGQSFYVVPRITDLDEIAEFLREAVPEIKFRAAHGDDVFHIAERLDVIDDGRAHPQTKDGRKIRRLDARIRALAFERFDEAGFLTADVSARAAMNVNLQIIAAAQNIFAEEVFRAGFRKRLIQNLRAINHFAADVDVGEMHVVGEARDGHAFDQLVRVLIHDLTILERAGFGFVRVADEINRLAALAVNEAPLEAAGKSRAAAAAQAGDFHVLADLFRAGKFFAVGQILGLEGERLLQNVVAAVTQIALDVRRVTRFIGIFQNQFVFLRHISNLTLNQNSLA